jgi:GNAT superfamily N-acetyltransferase
MMSPDGLFYRVLTMDHVMRDPELLATARTLTLQLQDRDSGMNSALNRFQRYLDRWPDKPLRAQAIFAHTIQHTIGWALLSQESDFVCFTAQPGHTCLQLFVHEGYRRRKVGQALVELAVELDTTNIIEVYAHDNYSFFCPLMQQFPRLQPVGDTQEFIDLGLHLSQLPPAQGWWLVSDIPEDTIDTYG